MKRIVIILLLLLLCVCNIKEVDEIVINVNNNDNAIDTEFKNMKEVNLTINDISLDIILNDNETSNNLIELLPLELSFEDYNNTEKISYLNDSIISDYSDISYDPKIDDICLYGSWNNLAIFYEDFGLSNNLVPIGHIEEISEIIKELGSFKATLEMGYR